MKRSALMVVCVLNLNCTTTQGANTCKGLLAGWSLSPPASKRRANTGSVGALQYCVRKCLT
ncbi:MAG: hypothetical protein CMK72_11515 [Pseudomonadaceae bacterium]|nr:hypothetical protein [Pseudomonadaceae bacterium]HCP54947.1 hypothetical protein [Pseudomonas sp.]